MYFKVMLRQLKDGSQCRKYLAMRVASRRIKWNRILFDAMRQDMRCVSYMS